MPGGRIRPPRSVAHLRGDPPPRVLYTTLELARAIATAVLRAPHWRRRDSRNDPATQAVLRTMRRHRVRFMTAKTDADGTFIGGTERAVLDARKPFRGGRHAH